MYAHTLITVPVEFPQTVWLNVYVGGGSPRHIKVPRRVLDLGPTTGRDLLFLLGQAEDIWIGDGTVRRLFRLFARLTFLGRWDGAPENVRIHGRNLLKIGDVETEILSDNLERGMNEPVGKHECGSSSVEVTIGEYQQEFEAIVQCLYTMRNALGESGEIW